jgi:hypothetical protein
MSFISQHKILTALIALVVFGLGWYVLSGGSSSPATLTTTVATGGSAADKNLVSTLLALRAVKLDGTIFSDPGFTSLKDFSTQIVPEPVGRPNPFAPLPSSASASASSTRSAQIFSPHH